MTGEDGFFHTALGQGADGGILASAHIETAAFARVRAAVLDDDRQTALAEWRGLIGLTKLLFREPNPAALKYWLWREGLIDSPDLRLPMTAASAELRDYLDTIIDRNRARAAE